jgi:multidrug efflux pump subunit AcrA (membrane-fusion protein)
LSEPEQEFEVSPVTPQGGEGLRLVATDGDFADPTTPLVEDDRLRRLTGDLLTAIGNLARSEAARAAAVVAAAKDASARRALEEAAAAQIRQIAELRTSVVAAAEEASSAAELMELRDRCVRLEGELERARGESVAVVEMHRVQVVELRREFEMQVAQLNAELEAVARERTPSWQSDPELSRHLVFFPTPAHGYILLERAGTVPRPGDVVDVSEHGGSATAVVTKAARSPCPGSQLGCAYLM